MDDEARRQHELEPPHRSGAQVQGVLHLTEAPKPMQGSQSAVFLARERIGPSKWKSNETRTIFNGFATAVMILTPESLKFLWPFAKATTLDHNAPIPLGACLGSVETPKRRLYSTHLSMLCSFISFHILVSWSSFRSRNSRLFPEAQFWRGDGDVGAKRGGRPVETKKWRKVFWKTERAWGGLEHAMTIAPPRSGSTDATPSIHTPSLSSSLAKAAQQGGEKRVLGLEERRGRKAASQSLGAHGSYNSAGSRRA